MLSTRRKAPLPADRCGHLDDPAGHPDDRRQRRWVRRHRHGCGQPDSACAPSADPAQTDAAFQALPGSLAQLIHALRAKAPSATIVLVTYPRLVPPTSCPALHYSPAATRLVASFGARLERVFVATAKAQHVRLVDPYVLGASHGPCAKGTDRWIAGLVPTNGFEYHPTAAGHQEMAHLVEPALES
jgi:hypothetical protein